MKNRYIPNIVIEMPLLNDNLKYVGNFNVALKQYEVKGTFSNYNL